MDLLIILGVILALLLNFVNGLNDASHSIATVVEAKARSPWKASISSGQVIADSVQAVAAGGIVCLTGVGSGGRTSGMVADTAALMVLRNNVVVGSVNANKRHWYKAGAALAQADRAWLSRLITRRERPEHFARALDRRADDIKVVVQFSEA